MLNEDIDSILSRAKTCDSKTGSTKNALFTVEKDNVSIEDKDFWGKILRGNLKTASSLKVMLSGKELMEIQQNIDFHMRFLADVSHLVEHSTKRKSDPKVIIEVKELLDKVESTLTLSKSDKRSIDNYRKQVAKFEANAAKLPEVPITLACTETLMKNFIRYGFGRWDILSSAVLKKVPNTKFDLPQIRSLSENVASGILEQQEEDKENSKSTPKSTSKSSWESSYPPLLAKCITDANRQTLKDMITDLREENPNLKGLVIAPPLLMTI